MVSFGYKAMMTNVCVYMFSGNNTPTPILWRGNLTRIIVAPKTAGILVSGGGEVVEMSHDDEGFILDSCAFGLWNWQGVRTQDKTERPFVLTSIVEKGFERAMLAVRQRWHVLLHGPAGAGKTALISSTNYALMNPQLGQRCPRHISATRKLYSGNMSKECIKFPTLA
nr:midasin isoform X4 [Tanacetum cinerariifolium]